MSKPIIKHTAKNDPALKFWAEPNRGPGSKVESYAVVSQVEGFPATEAHDDWFGLLQDADGLAKTLAEQAPAPDEELLTLRKRNAFRG